MEAYWKSNTRFSRNEGGMTDKPIVIYHGNCQDGFTAAWAVWRAHPGWDFYPAKHGDPPPDVTDRIVYMVDFSYKRPVILELAKQAQDITILDHHKTAEADLVNLPDNVFVHFDLGKSGARLAWEHFHSYVDVPNLVRYVEDRDLWRFVYPETKAFSAYLFSLEYDFSLWEVTHTEVEYDAERGELPNELLLAGKSIIRKQEKDTKELLQNKFRITIGGYETWTCNLPYTFSSDAGHILAQGQPFGSTFYLDGNYAHFSLRSTDDGIDVSEIAKQYGGGGHKHAAGFKTGFPVRPI
jgi:oligoribonuclease NrnB/cAMP/cGMP phosphodiesterase (DHH superfamily)